MLQKSNAVPDTRIYTETRSVKPAGIVRLKPIKFALVAISDSNGAVLQTGACRKLDTTGRQTELLDIFPMETGRDGLLAVANFGSHTTLLAANFATSLACSLRSHSVYCSGFDRCRKVASR
jgi:hypothetical protein